MFANPREMIAYGLIALLVTTLVPTGMVIAKRRKRMKLRRRGLKKYGH